MWTSVGKASHLHGMPLQLVWYGAAEAHILLRYLPALCPLTPARAQCCSHIVSCVCSMCVSTWVDCAWQSLSLLPIYCVKAAQTVIIPAYACWQHITCADGDDPLASCPCMLLHWSGAQCDVTVCAWRHCCCYTTTERTVGSHVAVVGVVLLYTGSMMLHPKI